MNLAFVLDLMAWGFLQVIRNFWKNGCKTDLSCTYPVIFPPKLYRWVFRSFLVQTTLYNILRDIFILLVCFDYTITHLSTSLGLWAGLWSQEQGLGVGASRTGLRREGPGPAEGQWVYGGFWNTMSRRLGREQVKGLKETGIEWRLERGSSQKNTRQQGWGWEERRIEKTVRDGRVFPAMESRFWMPGLPWRLRQ